tara:strand:- start:3234 stop:3557 length:324 start_codon:yes stop_codon:yes gene_type:complete
MEERYDDDDAPKSVEDGIKRIIESIMWEVLEEEMGLYKESPFSNYSSWKDVDKKRYDKSAKKLIKLLESFYKVDNNKKVENVVLTEEVNAKYNKSKTLRDYMREHVG